MALGAPLYPRVALLALGMVGRIAPTLRDQLLKLVIAVSEGQGEDAADQLEKIGERTDGQEKGSHVRGGLFVATMIEA